MAFFFFFGLITSHKTGTTELFSELLLWHSHHITHWAFLLTTQPESGDAGCPWGHLYKLCPIETGETFSDTSLKVCTNAVGHCCPAEVGVGPGERAEAAARLSWGVCGSGSVFVAWATSLRV